MLKDAAATALKWVWEAGITPLTSGVGTNQTYQAAVTMSVVRDTPEVAGRPSNRLD
jgi:hypothetical protein